MDFSKHAGGESKSPLVPGGTLAFVHVNVRETKLGKSPSTSRYMDCELTIRAPHPYADRKIYTKIADPEHPGNSDDWKQMGQNAICRILEVNGANLQTNPAGYNLQRIEDIHNKVGAIRVRVEEGSAGYQDKNEVGEWLTPNATSKSGHKSWPDLVAGNVLPKGTQAAAPAAGAILPNMFPNAAPAPQTPAPAAWAPPANPIQGAAPASAPTVAPAWSAPAAGISVPAQAAPTPSPSSPAAPSAAPWLTQANQTA